MLVSVCRDSEQVEWRLLSPESPFPPHCFTVETSARACLCLLQLRAEHMNRVLSDVDEWK